MTSPEFPIRSKPSPTSPHLSRSASVFPAEARPPPPFSPASPRLLLGLAAGEQGTVGGHGVDGPPLLPDPAL